MTNADSNLLNWSSLERGHFSRCSCEKKGCCRLCQAHNSIMMESIGPGVRSDPLNTQTLGIWWSNPLSRRPHGPYTLWWRRLDPDSSPMLRVIAALFQPPTIHSFVHNGNKSPSSYFFNQRYTLKGLNRPYIYDTLLTLVLQRTRKNSLH